MIRRLLLLAIFAPLVAAAQSAPAQPMPKPEIFFRAPVNNATVSSTFDVVFGLRNYGVAPAGINASMTGHFHIVVDMDAPATGELIPKDAVNLHYGTGLIETKITLPPGRHTLRLVLGDMDHKVIGPDLVSKPITITVR
ncbi:MAG: DUF4399 domain-containing protein [Gemmatimonadetes bacterium]|nr:DUF4399 domain-containing protein [Gemmatimonadota bacterium]